MMRRAAFVAFIEFSSSRMRRAMRRQACSSSARSEADSAASPNSARTAANSSANLLLNFEPLGLPLTPFGQGRPPW
jgi:hypothetical protein